MEKTSLDLLMESIGSELKSLRSENEKLRKVVEASEYYVYTRKIVQPQKEFDWDVF